MSSPDPQDHRQRALALQAAFFAPPNHWDPAVIGADADDLRALQTALRRHASGATDRGLLLPFRGPEGGPTVWFACAATMQMLRALQDELRAFLGPSYVKESPHGRLWDAADHHALPLIEAAGWHAIRLDSANLRADAVVMKQWRLYDELLNRRPRAPAHVPSTFHQIRASLDRALLARDEAGALAAMAALRERFGVSAENRQFLEIRLNAAFERWDAIADHPLLPQLIHLQLPPETYGDVMEALYRSRVQAFESASTLEPLLEQFREEIADRAQPLFATRRTSSRPAVLKAFLLHELIQKEPQMAVCEQLLQQLPAGAFGSADTLVRQRCTQTAPRADIETALAALNDEQFDRAWDLLWSLPDSVDVLRGLIACARESADPTKATAVLTRLESADDAIRGAVESASATRLANLRAGYQAPPASSGLAAQMVRWPGETDDRFVERWTEFARSAEPGTILAQTSMVGAAVDFLMQTAVEDPGLFERLYPSWHELFIERADPHPRWVPLYLEMLEALRARDVFRRTELELLHQVLVAIIESGDDAAYRQAVDTVTKIFEVIRSPQALGWALDVCDSLSQRRVRDADARMRLLTHVIQACREFASRLDSMQSHQLRLLVEEANLDSLTLPSAPSQRSSHTVEHDATPYRIAIYSLDEPATRRAVEILKSLHPRWIVDTNADQVCSDRLKYLAQKAHVFIFAWRCSKHAAYYCVKASGNKDSLVMARGVGTTSLVAAATDFLLGQNSNVSHRAEKS